MGDCLALFVLFFFPFFFCSALGLCVRGRGSAVPSFLYFDVVVMDLAGPLQALEASPFRTNYRTKDLQRFRHRVGHVLFGRD